jgi:hypothetical protein
MGGLEQIHAADAYARGYSGAGVTIGFVDFNFDFNSTEVNYSPLSVGPNAQMVALDTAVYGSPQTDQHGQATASTAAARKNNFGIQGIAYNATVLAVDYYSDVNDFTDVEQIGSKSYTVHTSDPFTYLTSHGARIVNTSYGYDTGSGVPIPRNVSELYQTTSPATAVINGALLVASAGNSGTHNTPAANPSQSNIDILSDMQNAGIVNSQNVYISGQGAFIIAGAVDSSNQIAYFSNRAGSYANFYMVAPGVNLTLPWNGSLQAISGTSFSSPLIAGAAALILERWPQLTARQVSDILLTSATDLGAPGVDNVYGHGLLNVDAALQPNGVTTFAVANGNAPAVNVTGMVLGTAFGDAPAFRAAISNVAFLDSYGRDYEVDLSRAAAVRPGFSDLFSVMQQRLGWHFAGVPLGSTSQLDLDVRANPTDGITGFAPSGGLEASLADHQSVMRFSGGTDGASWVIGNGLSLRDALAENATDDPFTTLSISQGFAAPVGGAASSFAGVRLQVGEDTHLSLGLSNASNQGIPAYAIGSIYHDASQAAVMRLDERIGDSLLGLEAGGMVEEGGVLGSLASGALKMADHSSTSWLSASYQRALADHWSLKGSMTVSMTTANSPEGSIITSIGPIYATSIALGLARSDVWDTGDAWSFAIAQPLHAERAPVSLAFGTGVDASTGKTILQSEHSSLTPSGREIDFESGYRFPIGDWNGAANIAYSIDSADVHGGHAVAGLFWLSRKF